MVNRLNKRTAKLMLSWCIQKYGPSKYANVNTLLIEIDTEIAWLGQYLGQKNTILVNPKMHRSLVSWCETIIHEYTHFQQDMHKYHEYRNRYDKHPYEIACNNRANRDKFEARKWLLRKLGPKV